MALAIVDDDIQTVALSADTHVWIDPEDIDNVSTASEFALTPAEGKQVLVRLRRVINLFGGYSVYDVRRVVAMIKAERPRTSDGRTMVVQWRSDV